MVPNDPAVFDAWIHDLVKAEATYRLQHKWIVIRADGKQFLPVSSLYRSDEEEKMDADLTRVQRLVAATIVRFCRDFKIPLPALPPQLDPRQGGTQPLAGGRRATDASAPPH
jgi:hypothetical protein